MCNGTGNNRTVNAEMALRGLKGETLQGQCG